MARAGILYSQVAKAASQLAAAGKAPTIDTVREALGDTGSKSTIAPMLKRWKTEHQEVVAGGDTGLPVDLVEAVKGVYQRL
ncbi:DNA-binding protein, partial [Salmonella enterica]